MGNGIELEHVCGGVCACSTCHVIVKKGLETCNEGTDDEFDQLEEAPITTLQSRLGCQCVPNGTKDIVVEIPAVNKNLVKEGLKACSRTRWTELKSEMCSMSCEGMTVSRYPRSSTSFRLVIGLYFTSFRS